MRAAYQTRLLLNGGGALLAGAGALLLGWSLLDPVQPPPPSSRRTEPQRLIAAKTPPVESSVDAAVLAIPERRFQQPVIDPPPPPPPPPMLAAAPLPSVQLPREVRLVGVVYSEDVAQRVALIRVSETAVESRMTGEALTAHPSVLLKSIDRQSVVLESQGTAFSLKVPQEASQSFFKRLP